jgi:hypothetical protein
MTTTPATSQYDPMDDAMSAQPASLERTYFGEVTTVDVWACVLEKGIGKRAFNEGQDDPGQRRTVVKLQVAVERKDGGSYTVDQDVITTAPEWTKFTLPSLRTLQLDLRTLRGRFVRLTRKSTGSTYVNKSNETKDRTAIVFEEVFADAAACKAAADAFYGSRQNGGSNGMNGQQPQSTQPANGASPADQQEREFAKNSLQILWQAAGKNEQAFHAMIAANPMISKYFSPTSPEVQDISMPF